MSRASGGRGSRRRGGRASSRDGAGERSGRGSARERVVDVERYVSIVPDWPAFLEAAQRPEPTVFRVRTGRIAEHVLLERLAQRGFVTTPVTGLPGLHQVVDGPSPVSMTPEHWHGLIYVQQASTAVAAPALSPRPGERVLDLCSAPGGKTTHMADLMNDSGCLVAAEISEPRIRGLLGNVYRLAHPNIVVVAGDGRDFPLGASFDRVLVDAPCSGEGTLRRRGGQAPNQSESFLAYVTGAQRGLLERAVRLTRTGGTILYVTCTFAPEENEAVLSDALERLPVELEPLELPVPHARGVTSWQGKRYDPRVEGAARIYPHHLDSGGLFLARLRKLDDGAGSAGSTALGAPSPRDGGWGPVPHLFPGEELGVAAVQAPGGKGGGQDTAHLIEQAGQDAVHLIERAVVDLADRYGVGRGLERVRWVMRGGRAWMHTLDEWPVDAWLDGGRGSGGSGAGADASWRVISVGLRAIDFDTQGRPRPTNDFLRWLGGAVTDRAIDLDDDTLASLLRRDTVPTDIDDRGPIVLRVDGETIGRGAVTVDGLKSEIPKARAVDYRRVLEATATG